MLLKEKVTTFCNYSALNLELARMSSFTLNIKKFKYSKDEDLIALKYL